MGNRDFVGGEIGAGEKIVFGYRIRHCGDPPIHIAVKAVGDQRDAGGMGANRNAAQGEQEARDDPEGQSPGIC